MIRISKDQGEEPEEKRIHSENADFLADPILTPQDNSQWDRLVYLTFIQANIKITDEEDEELNFAVYLIIDILLL